MAQTLLLQNARLIDGLRRAAPSKGPYPLINGDPLRDPRELRKLTTVYCGGVAHDPQAILARAP